MLKQLLTTALLGCALLASSASATLLTFDNSNDLGVALQGDMRWKATGGGHLYNEMWNSNDHIVFDEATYVNGFDMNAMPWQGYTGGTIGQIDIAGFTADLTQVWSTTVDLTDYRGWSDWLYVSVETSNISKLTFYAPGSAPHNNGFWPSIDNMVINEQSVPEPGTLAIFGLGLLGFTFSRKSKK